MCVEVRRAGQTVPRWCPDDVAIDVPDDLTYGQAVALVRMILTELGARQSTMGAALVCFCGEPVTVQGLIPHRRRAARIPRQRIDVTEVARGA